MLSVTNASQHSTVYFFLQFPSLKKILKLVSILCCEPVAIKLYVISVTFVITLEGVDMPHN